MSRHLGESEKAHNKLSCLVIIEPFRNPRPERALLPPIASTDQLPAQPVATRRAETIDCLGCGLALRTEHHDIKGTGALWAGSFEVASHDGRPISPMHKGRQWLS
jgi:hypothetical protein